MLLNAAYANIALKSPLHRFQLVFRLERSNANRVMYIFDPHQSYAGVLAQLFFPIPNNVTRESCFVGMLYIRYTLMVLSDHIISQVSPE